jgi:V/A-type H+-transporting ATPase subunit C
VRLSLVERLRRTKYLNVGIAPLLSLYLAREHELKLVRMLLAGKVFNVPQEQLRLRLREIYG